MDFDIALSEPIWCEALSYDEISWPAKGNIRGGCHANLFFGAPIENLEYQTIVSENGAKFASGGMFELHVGQGHFEFG